MKAVSKFNYITVDGIGYLEPEESMTYDEAMEWAKTRGLRLLTRGEWCDLYDDKEEFRKSCQSGVYWTASLCASYPNSTWGIVGSNGDMVISSHDRVNTVRAVLAEPEGQQQNVGSLE